VEQRGGDDIRDGVDGGGAVGLSLTLAPSIDQCLGFVGHCVGTVNISSYAPPRAPFIWRCARGGPLPQERQTFSIRMRDGNLS
jgi:hypothetical protein